MSTRFTWNPSSLFRGLEVSVALPTVLVPRVGAVDGGPGPVSRRGRPIHMWFLGGLVLLELRSDLFSWPLAVDGVG